MFNEVKKNNHYFDEIKVISETMFGHTFCETNYNKNYNIHFKYDSYQFKCVKCESLILLDIFTSFTAPPPMDDYIFFKNDVWFRFLQFNKYSLFKINNISCNEIIIKNILE